MHPKEAKHQRTGTGRLSHLCLPNSEILHGIDFSANERLCQLLADSRYAPMLLYPAPDAQTLKNPELAPRLEGKTLLVIIIDSTWFCSKKMLRLSTNLHALPRLSFAGTYRSIFTFKREPKEYCVSTIESCYYLIQEAKNEGLVPPQVNAEPLMTVFKKMIAFQLTQENERIAGRLPSNHAKDWKYTQKKVLPDFL